MSTSAKASSPVFRLLRGTEVAEILGISRPRAYQLMKDGTLPVVRIGRSVRVPSTELEKWIAARIERGEQG
jgi:excisionase family DNA binding protein